MSNPEDKSGQLSLDQALSAPAVKKGLSLEERARNRVNAARRVPSDNLKFGELSATRESRTIQVIPPSAQSQEPDERPDPEDVHRFAEWLTRHPGDN